MKYITSAIIFSGVLFLSGCSLPGMGGSSATVGQSAIQRSLDGGRIFTPQATINEKTSFDSASVLSMTITGEQGEIIYAGLESGGIMKSKNQGDTWENLDFPPEKVYGIGTAGQEIVYAIGQWEERGRAYKSIDSGKNWEEIYAEPTGGTVLTSMAVNPQIPEMIFIGTSEGVVFKTTDAGQSWSGVATTKEPITSIIFDPREPRTIYLQLFGKSELMRSRDTGRTFERLQPKITEKIVQVENSDKPQKEPKEKSVGKITAIATSPAQAGLVILGTESGLVKSVDYGQTFEQMSVVGSVEEVPISAISADPQDTQKILFSAGQELYTYNNGAISPAKISIGSKQSVRLIERVSKAQGIIFAAMRAQ
ncbi:MAG: hypothetical protein KC736_01155 [Candidatus Moranbacteria bacterium]|nr:hypothetical protein [Candidatus Moranbacteria bacterium]